MTTGRHVSKTASVAILGSPFDDEVPLETTVKIP